MSNTTSVFAGNAAIAYAAFNLRDAYYREMARFVINAASIRLGQNPGLVVDLGSGIGISTMEILNAIDSKGRIVAVEPEEAMREFCKLNVMGDPRADVVEGKGETLSKAIVPFGPTDGLGFKGVPRSVDAVLCCQVFHLFNPPGKDSLIPTVLREIATVLRRGGVFAFDLGPSNYEFALKLVDHRITAYVGEIVTELAHPLYQRAHRIMLDIVRREVPDFNRDNLWPTATARMSLKFLSDACTAAGLHGLTVREELSPVNGARVINFIRNGWTVFFRWSPLSELPMERKIELMNEALNRLFKENDFSEMSSATSYHPTAVFTAVKA